MDKIYLNKYILSYDEICSLLDFFTKDNKYKCKLIKEPTLCQTNFGYPINSYKLGNGKEHVIMLANTHGSEIVTGTFLMEFITTLLKNNTLYEEYSNRYTFHFIPLLNPEGYIISTSQVLYNIKDLDIKQIQELAGIYLHAYNLDDKLAKKCYKMDKFYKHVLTTNTCFIPDDCMRKSVKKILNNCHLTDSVLPIWSANGVGIDPNSNSIHRFCEMVKLRQEKGFANLRYNDIPVTKPSPISFPGCCPLDKRCPENVFLYNYINYLYNNLPKMDSKLIAVFSYHSTGGEIYGYPDKCISSDTQIKLHEKAVDIYKNVTGYTPIIEELKYGVMDYYRACLEGTVSLTIELSKLNGNPIGPYADINGLLNEYILNKRAIFKTINSL